MLFFKIFLPSEILQQTFLWGKEEGQRCKKIGKKVLENILLVHMSENKILGILVRFK
jgi:hypothetical protein